MIDAALLPASALLDTGVFLRALGDRPDDNWAPDCVEFFKTMRDGGRDLLVAAPTFSEFLRGRRGTKLPVMAGVVTVAFDGSAAQLLGESFPMDLLIEFHKQSGDPLAYYKYDAMIVACAERWEAPCIVALDKGVHRLAKERNVRCEYPDAFRTKQGSLALVHAATATGLDQGVKAKPKR